jgi:hypothetical protein
MMTDPDRQELLHDLLQEDAAALRETSLQRMIAAGRRRRVQRRAFRAALCAAVLLACSLWLLPGKPVRQAQVPPRPVPAAQLAKPQKEFVIRHLTEAEMKERLSGFAVAYVGKPGAQRVVLLEDTPR